MLKYHTVRCGSEFASRSLHMGFVVDETESGKNFLRVSPLPQISLLSLSILISFISFHFIRPCDNASGMVGRQPCYSQTFNMEASWHRIPRPGPVSDRIIYTHILFSTFVRHRTRSRVEMWRSVICRMPTDHAWRDECGDMVKWNLWQGETGETPRKT